MNPVIIRRIHSPVSVKLFRVALSTSCLLYRLIPTSILPFLLTSRPFSSHLAIMPTYIVTCKDDATPEQVAQAKKHATDQGGKIGHEYSLIKGFSVSFPEDSVTTLEKHEHVKAVEKDQEVKTQ
ncbi:hypothetical protein QBC33DRAFT_523212 [Phialemonium atrogriseum]|uniref:Inhibitor I9 domain-containing protein n=1 Tax=Phialemonium atrogriseum TaxID=1093897 RepID=A0AAJ0C6Z8_9PEZI|nr:uncharacterized protein QBC33DRAFT_523212 [Phialemonium atrogriseum]KAK1771294.1 hypothetical protein QBC33DRAFT_523212 [Phialemonium atrogriseum]